MSFTKHRNKIFNQAVHGYHITDNADMPINNPYDRDSIGNRLYLECWIDTIQWHSEDLIRDPHINPDEGMNLKHRVDRSSRDRTDLVEQIDLYFHQLYSDVTPLPEVTINTESPAQAVDRLSILALEIYRMKKQTEHKDVSAGHIEKYKSKLNIPLEQQKDLSLAIDQLSGNIGHGRKYMKVYHQMKMHNNPATNPILRSEK